MISWIPSGTWMQHLQWLSEDICIYHEGLGPSASIQLFLLFGYEMQITGREDCVIKETNLDEAYHWEEEEEEAKKKAKTNGRLPLAEGFILDI